MTVEFIEPSAPVDDVSVCDENNGSYTVEFEPKKAENVVYRVLLDGTKEVS